MRGLKYQFKILVKDKMVIISFLLPIIMAFAVGLITEDSFSSVENVQFVVFEENIEDNTINKLKRYGSVEIVSSIEKLEEKIIEPSDDSIGLALTEENKTIIIAGDETSYIKSIASNLLSMINLENANKIEEIAIDRASDSLASKQLFIGLTMLTALFVGCSFNAIVIISEKENGITKVNSILPIKKLDFLIQKIAVAFIGGVFVSLLTWLILKGIDISIIKIAILIVLASYFSAILGLFIGHFASDFLSAVVFIKFILVFFIAMPITTLLVDSSTILYKVLYVLIPSISVFNILNTIEGGIRGEFFTGLVIILLHCILWTYIYLKGLYKKARI
ncbi:MAG: ABC transporter permease [Peptoniphilaceae bacterium]